MLELIDLKVTVFYGGLNYYQSDVLSLILEMKVAANHQLILTI